MWFALASILILLTFPLAAQDEALRRAAQLDAEQKCSESERFYREALAKGTPSAALLNNAGNHYAVCGQPEKARSLFERLLKLNPAHPNANLQLARIETEQKRGAEALRHLDQVRESGPAILLLRAEALYWAGKRQDASALLDQIEQQAQGDPRVLFTLGIACARMELYGRAEAAFNSVLARYPGNFDVLLNLGRAAALAGHYDRARRALEVAAKLQPESADTLFELGRVYGATHDSSRAVYVLANASRIAPKRADILLALARAAQDAGFYGDALVAYGRYLEIRPGDSAARRDRALVRGLTNEGVAAAVQELKAYTAEHPRDPIGHYNLAQLTWKSAPEEALAQLSVALRLNPQFASARYSRGWLLQRVGRTEEAPPDLEAAAAAMPGDAGVLAQLGRVYLALGRAADAERVLRQGLAAAPEDPQILMNLGRALMALGREEEATHFMQEFQRVRPQRTRGPRLDAGMIESATLPEPARVEREIRRLREAARAHTDDPELQLHLALMLLADGRAAEATAEFRRLLTLQAHTRIWEQAGAALLHAEEYELARDFLRLAATDTPAARLDLAIAVFFTEGAKPALDILEQVPANARGGDYLLMKARILDAAGRGSEAGPLLEQALRQSASRPKVAREGALLLYRHNRKQEALALLDRAIETHPDDAGLLLTKATLLGVMDQSAAAEKLLDQIESRWPEWDRAYLVHGLLLERGPRSADARRKIQTAAALGAADPATRCALERAGAAETKDTGCCTCEQGLEQLLFPSCERPCEAAPRQ